MAFKFMQTGAESVKMAQQAQVEAEARRAMENKMFRFFLDEKEDARITFVDGSLDQEHGCLLPPRWYEHTILVNGQWQNFVCPEKTNPNSGDKCPICEGGDRPTLVCAFTVIDHRIIKGKKDPSKVYKDTRKLFIAKPGSFEILNKIAMQLGGPGLAGRTFMVSRVGAKAPSVGDTFLPVELKSVEELQKLYVEEKTDPKTNHKTVVTKFTPADYENEIPYRTGNELRALGLGKPQQAGMVHSPAGKAPEGGTDYSSQL